jgi:hypothetical protein
MTSFGRSKRYSLSTTLSTLITLTTISTLVNLVTLIILISRMQYNNVYNRNDPYHPVIWVLFCLFSAVRQEAGKKKRDVDKSRRVRWVLFYYVWIVDLLVLCDYMKRDVEKGRRVRLALVNFLG